MADGRSIFPAFIQARYEPGNAFADLKRDAGAAGAAAGDSLARNFRASAGELRQVLNQALSGTSGAALDLGVPQMRQAAQAAEQHAAALRQTAAAAGALAAGERALSAAQQAVFATVQASLAAAENDAATKREQVAVYEQLQVKVNELAGSMGRLTAAEMVSQRAGIAHVSSVGQQRAAYQQLGFQIQDTTMQIGLGINPLVILAQQGGQTAFALSQFGGALGRVGGFLSGPWGAAILGGVTIMGLFASRSTEAEHAQLNLADAADTLGHAQGLLGHFIDLTTGKQTGQNEVMREAIRLTAILAQLEAARAGREAGARLGAMNPSQFLDRVTGRPDQGFSLSDAGGGFGTGPGTVNTGVRNPGVAAFQNLVRGYRQNANASVAEFRRQIEAMSSRGELQGIDVNSAVREAITIASNRQEIAAMGDVRRVAEGGALPSYLRRPRSGGGRTGSGRRPTDQAEFGEDAGARISNITSRFEDAPAQVEAVRRAMGELNDVASDLERRRPPNYDALVAQLGQARETVAEGLLKPYRDFLDQEQQSLDLQRLINSGRQEEAEAIQAIARIEERTGKLGEEQREEISRRIVLRAEEARQAEILQQRAQANQRAIGELRSSLENIFADPAHGLANLPGAISRSFNQLNGQAIIERMFGPALRELDDFASGRTRLKASNEALSSALDQSRTAVDRQASASEDLTEKLGSVATSAQAASDALAGLAGAPPGSDLANWDAAGSGPAWRGAAAASPALARVNASIQASITGVFDTIREAIENPDIVVTAIRPPRPPNNDNSKPKSALASPEIPDPRQLYRRAFTDLFVNVFHDKRVGTAFGNVMTNGLEGAQFGSMLQGVLQMGGVRLPSGVARGGGALLNQIPGFSQMAGPVGLAIAGNQFISKLLGNDEIKHGKLLSLVAGPFLTRLFGSALRGSSTITGVDSAITTVGNSGKYKAASATAAGSVQEMLAHIAEALGASVTGAGAVSIGVRKGDYRVDTTGRGITKTSKGAIDFGKDLEAATRAAVLNLIQDGVIGGVRAGTQRLLSATKDLDAGLQKALDFEGVFTELKARLDPFGAAMDVVDKRFDHLRQVFQEAGASTEEYAQLEQLYQLNRKEAITRAGEQMTSALKGLLADLTTNNEALSLRDRLASAHATYDPLAARVAAGDTSVDYGAFSDAAKTLIDIERQIDGSTQPYFDMLKQITDLTGQALAHQEGLISIANARPSPLGDASSPVSTSNPDTVSAIDKLGVLLVDRLGGEMRASNDNLASIIGLLASGSRGGGGPLSVDRGNF